MTYIKINETPHKGGVCWMMNYTGWDIPEGKVKQVADALGNVIWSAVKMANITVICKDYTGGGFAQIEIDDKTYSSIDREIYQIEVPIGTDIHCMIYDDQMIEEGEQYGYIKLNGVNVEEAKLFGWDFGYSYTVNGNAIIELLTDDYHYGYGRITITEVSNDPATITISKFGSDASVGVNYGNETSASEMQVPAGVVIKVIGSMSTYLGANGVPVIVYSPVNINGTSIGNRLHTFLRIYGDLAISAIAISQNPSGTQTFITVTNLNITGPCSLATQEEYDTQFR